MFLTLGRRVGHIGSSVAEAHPHDEGVGQYSFCIPFHPDSRESWVHGHDVTFAYDQDHLQGQRTVAEGGPVHGLDARRESVGDQLGIEDSCAGPSDGSCRTLLLRLGEVDVGEPSVGGRQRLGLGADAAVHHEPSARLDSNLEFDVAGLVPSADPSI